MFTNGPIRFVVSGVQNAVRLIEVRQLPAFAGAIEFEWEK